LTLAATLWENITIGPTYTAYTSPNDSLQERPGMDVGYEHQR